jgi:hypothetical protein
VPCTQIPRVSVPKTPKNNAPELILRSPSFPFGTHACEFQGLSKWFSLVGVLLNQKGEKSDWEKVVKINTELLDKITTKAKAPLASREKDKDVVAWLLKELLGHDISEQEIFKYAGRIQRIKPSKYEGESIIRVVVGLSGH